MAPIVALLIKSGLSIFAGAVASKGSDYIKEKTGIDLESALGTEEGRLRLKQLEMEHQEFLVTAAQASEVRDLEYFKLEVADKDSARDREVEIAKASGAPWWAPNFVSWLTMFVVAGGGYMFFNINNTETRYAIIAIVSSVLQYYYGTTRQSAVKDETIKSAVGGQR